MVLIFIVVASTKVESTTVCTCISFSWNSTISVPPSPEWEWRWQRPSIPGNQRAIHFVLTKHALPRVRWNYYSAYVSELSVPPEIRHLRNVLPQYHKLYEPMLAGESACLPGLAQGSCQIFCPSFEMSAQAEQMSDFSRLWFLTRE